MQCNVDKGAVGAALQPRGDSCIPLFNLHPIRAPRDRSFRHVPAALPVIFSMRTFDRRWPCRPALRKWRPSTAWGV